MTFGAVNLSPPELVISKEAFAGCDNITQVCAHTPADDSLSFVYDIASCADTLAHYQLCKQDALRQKTVYMLMELVNIKVHTLNALFAA